MSLRIPVVATGQSCPGAAPAANCVHAGDSAETQAWLSEDCWTPGKQRINQLSADSPLQSCAAPRNGETQPRTGQMSVWLPVSLRPSGEESSPAPVFILCSFEILHWMPSEAENVCVGDQAGHDPPSGMSSSAVTSPSSLLVLWPGP